MRRERKCHYQGECAITDMDQNRCQPGSQEILSDLSSKMCPGGPDAAGDIKACNEGVKCKHTFIDQKRVPIKKFSNSTISRKTYFNIFTTFWRHLVAKIVKIVEMSVYLPR